MNFRRRGRRRMGSILPRTTINRGLGSDPSFIPVSFFLLPEMAVMAAMALFLVAVAVAQPLDFSGELSVSPPKPPRAAGELSVSPPKPPRAAGELSVSPLKPPRVAGELSVSPLKPPRVIARALTRDYLL